MQTIDQRIIIPAAPDVIWATLSDISQNPTWMQDCEAITFVSTAHSGPGTRWRSTIRKGHDALIQVSAWYNGLGYEYTIVDGVPYKQNVGRIRLQEVPEGTVVQWTFSYDPKGVRGARHLDGIITDSLRTLYKLMQVAREKRPLEPKSLMRDDPGVEARSTYKPRHPSSVELKQDDALTDTQPKRPVFPLIAEPPITDDDNQFIPVARRLELEEPPVEQDDTRPRPPVPLPVDAPPSARREPMAPTVIFDEPDFLNDIQTPIERITPAADAMFMPPRRETLVVEPPPAVEDTKPVRTVEIIPESVTNPTVVEPQQPETPPITSVPSVESASFATSVQPAADVAGAFVLPIIESDAEVGDDTASIWDVFNLPRPSETQEMRAIQAQREALATPEPEVILEIQPPRMGLRAFQRRRIVKVQRPSVD